MIVDRGPGYNQQRFLMYIEFKQIMQSHEDCDMWDYATYCARFDGDCDTPAVFVSSEVYRVE